MKIEEQINSYISSQPEAKRNDMLALHKSILKLQPACTLWFLDGKNSEGRIVSNPNVGYGTQNIKYADGSTRPFYQVGMSANTSGISIYIMSIKDKAFLNQTYGKTLGKATITGYCIKFKALKDIHVDVLKAAIRCGLESNIS